MQPAAHRQERSLRSRLRTTVLVPTAALVVVWIVVSGYLVYGAVVQYSVARGTDQLLVPAAKVLTDIMNERSATVAFLARRDGGDRAMKDARAKSNKQVEEILAHAGHALPFSSSDVQERIAQLDERFSGIKGIRDRVDSGDAGRAEALEYYNSLSMAGADLLDEQARANPARDVVGPALSAAYAFRVLDTLSLADARLSSSFASRRLTFDDQQQFTRLSGNYRGTLETIRANLGPDQQKQLGALERSEHWQLMRNMERRIIEREVDDTSRDPSAPPISERAWRTSFTRVQDTLTDISTDQAEYAGRLQTSVALQTVALALLGSVGVAGMAGAAIVVSRRSSQRLIDRLDHLSARSRELADNRLPRIVERLGRNEAVDVGTELPELGQSDDEIGQVARAFNAAQRTAVQAAVQQAQLRQGVNKVFVNLAHRSQTLAHRQLRLLDTLEHEQEDPEKLTELFALDHLATRSRRNAENLLILGGENPGRTRRRPTPLIDVVRGAISESGDYARVERGTIARTSIIGPAVADIIHLVAELVDNATAFSPPHTKVQLRAQRVLGGVSIEVADRGLGMTQSEVEAANKLLADPPPFDAMRFSENTRLGLFVVSRLAQRHGIQVTLRRSPFGGVQAVVLLPPAIVSATPLPAADSATQPHGMPAAAVRPSRRTGPTAPDPAPELEPTPGGLPRRSPGRSRNVPDPTPLRDSPRADSPRPDPPRGPAERPALPRRTPKAGPPPGAPARGSDNPTAPVTPIAVDDPDTPTTSRSTRLRRSMSAFQQGTLRGRDDGRRSLEDRPDDNSPPLHETPSADDTPPGDGTGKDR